MLLEMLSFGQKMPSWLNTGIQEYQKRFRRPYTLQITELALLKRTKTSDLQGIFKKESDLMLSHIKPAAHVIALEVNGKQFSSEQLAKRLLQLENKSSHCQLLIGGPEGLSQECSNSAQESWSLSFLTLSHPLVRLFLAETLYRSWAINQNHPYHK